MGKEELPFVKEMFDTIAPKYDLLNRLLSMRQDVYWRRKMIHQMDIPPDGNMLDMACGTGDVIMEALRRKGPGIAVTGVDFSPKMLYIAKEKTGGHISLMAGNALYPPFKPDTFDAVTIAFGIRNIKDKTAALNAFYNCLKPGGNLLILELATPKKGPLLNTYMFYFGKILPLIGKLFSKHRFAYTYLPDSVINFPDADTFSKTIASCGFKQVQYHRLTLGVANLFKGIK